MSAMADKLHIELLEATTRTPSEIIDRLAEVAPELLQSLAALQGAPSDIAEVTLAAHRFGTRTLLAAAGVIRTDSAPANQLSITDCGWEVIALCSKRYPEQDRDVDAAIERARARLYHADAAHALRLEDAGLGLSRAARALSSR